MVVFYVETSLKYSFLLPAELEHVQSLFQQKMLQIKQLYPQLLVAEEDPIDMSSLYTM